MSNCRIMLGCVALPVLDLAARYPDHIGLLASPAQVPATGLPGYGGVAAEHFKQRAPRNAVWRDHAKTRAVITHDVQHSHYHGIMPDTTDFLALYRLARSKVSIEIGAGEAGTHADVIAMFHMLKGLESKGLAPRIRVASLNVGTHLNNGANRFDSQEAKRACDSLRFWLPFPLRIRAHNCDFLSLQDLAALRELGVQDFNFAPEVAYVITQTRIAVLQHWKVNYVLMKWASATLQDGRYRRWHDTRWEYGAHYTFDAIESAVPVPVISDINARLAQVLQLWAKSRIEIINAAK